MNPETLFEEHQKLVPYTINRYFKKHIFNEDVCSAGNLGLWKACLNFKPEKGAFSTIAVRYIQGYIQHELFDHKSVFTKLTLDYSYLLPYHEPHYNKIESKMFVEHFLSTLEPAESELCKILIKDPNKNEAGRKLGVSHTTIDNRLRTIQCKYKRYMKRRRNAKAYINHLHSLDSRNRSN